MAFNVIFTPQAYTTYSGTLTIGNNDPYNPEIAVDLQGNSTSGVDENNSNLINGYSLNSIYPNPFNNETVFNFSLPRPGLVAIKIFNLQGKEIAEVANQHYSAGTFSLPFNASDLPSGIYFADFQIDEFQQINKIVLIK